MGEMRLFGLKSCDTSRAALRDLRAVGHDPLVIDIRDDGVTDKDRTAMLSALGPGLVNRASTTWRGLSEADRNRDVADLLTAFPTLMKRPIIESDGEWSMGWGKDTQQRLLG